MKCPHPNPPPRCGGGSRNSLRFLPPPPRRGGGLGRGAVFAAIFVASSAGAVDGQSSAIVRLETAAEEGSRELQTAEATVDLNASIASDSGWSLTAVARVRGDTEDRLEPGRPDQHERSAYNRRWILSDTADAELREFYIDGHIGPAFLRLGKQQVVWGQADGLRVLDVVNPFSFREFIWPDPQDRRIPLWTLKAEVPVGPATLQLLWLPDPTYDEIPLGDAAFAITTPLLVPRPTRPIEVRPALRPKGVEDGSDAGARLSAFVGGWDITLNYLYHYYDDPVPFIVPTQTGPVLAPRYERSRLFGATFSNAFGSTTLRGEAGYSTDRWFITESPLDVDRVFSSDELAFVVGVDNTALTNTLLSVQYFESRLQTVDPLMTREPVERQATLVVQRSFRNDSWKLRALWLSSLTRDDGGVQARLSWQASANISVGISMEKFYGDRDGLFGEFRDASRAGIDFQWSWSRSR